MINFIVQVFLAITVWCSVSVGILRFTLSNTPPDLSQLQNFSNLWSAAHSQFLPMLSHQEWLLLGFFAIALAGAFLVTGMLLWLVQRVQYRFNNGMTSL